MRRCNNNVQNAQIVRQKLTRKLMTQRVYILSWNRDGEFQDPSCDAIDPPATESPSASESGRGREFGFAVGLKAGSANGFSSVMGVRAGPVRIIGTPLTGLIGDPRASRVDPSVEGTKACEPLQ